MDGNRLVKLIVTIALVFVIWKYGIPWAKQKFGGHTASSEPVENSCVASAQRASEAWGGGLSRFVNPPYDLAAWSAFRGDVEAKITAAESECRDSSPSCEAARSAMSGLRSLVADMDRSITTGSAPPDDAVQRQAAIDTKIESAADLVRAGK
jgi:hypothetical protein